MSDFKGYVCWDERTVAGTVATEAVNPSDNVFLATHSPLDIHRTTVQSGKAGATKVVSEEDVVNDFLTRATNYGVLIMPVLGESGTGKSHLVRWALAKTTPTDDRQIIYLPKDRTSLADVVELLLAGNEGEPFDGIRADLGRLGRDMTAQALQHALLDKLAAALLVASAESPRERALVGEFGLRTLLVDPFVRPKILRPEGVIVRRADYILNGRGESSDDLPMEFTEDDLPLDMADIDEASAPARRIFGRLASDPQLQTAAYRMLQQHLDVAVMEATNLGVGRVSKAFLEIRRALVGKKEIILLIEDFALVQGIQRDLLDAITETGERKGAALYAPVRTLMAVTSGYFGDLPSTTRTRIDAAMQYQYGLRVSIGSDAEPKTEQRVIDLMGRYLNAARVGRVRLESEGVRSPEETPNACSDCLHREECHSGFGVSSDGYGLYPYNRPALLRVVRAATLAERRGEFNPRAALAQGIRGVLQEQAEDIRKGQFPNSTFEERFPRRLTGSVVSSSVQAQINRADPHDADRRQVLMQYWGDAPTELVNLPEAIHTAFALPPLDNVDVSVEPSPDEEDPPTPTSVGPTYPPSLVKKLTRIENWHARNEPMVDDDARVVRSIVRQAIFSRISWTEPLMKEPTLELLDKAWPVKSAARMISIEGANETGARGVTPLIRFDRSPENALFFADLFKLDSEHREGTLGALLRLRQIAEQFAPAARDKVSEIAERDDQSVVAGMRVSLIGAALAGIVRPGDRPEDLLSAAVTKLNGSCRADAGGSTPQWDRLLDVHLAERDGLVTKLREAVGTAQGTAGAVHAIDAERALRLVTLAAEQWTLGSAGLPDWAKKAARPFVGANLEKAAGEMLAWLDQLRLDIRRRLPAGTSMRETVKAVTAAFEVGERASLVLVPNLPVVRAANERAADLRSASVDKLERDLDRLGDTASWTDRLAVAAEDRGRDLIRIRDYLVSSEDWLDAGLQAPLGTPSEETQQLVDDLAVAATQWTEITGRLGGDQT